MKTLVNCNFGLEIEVKEVKSVCLGSNMTSFINNCNFFVACNLEVWSVCHLQTGSFCRTDSSLISKNFQRFLKEKKEKENERQAGPTWENQARTASYLCNKLGRSPRGKPPKKLSGLQTVSRCLGSSVIPAQVTSKTWTSGLLDSI